MQFTTFYDSFGNTKLSLVNWHAKLKKVYFLNQRFIKLASLRTLLYFNLQKFWIKTSRVQNLKFSPIFCKYPNWNERNTRKEQVIQIRMNCDRLSGTQWQIALALVWLTFQKSSSWLSTTVNQQLRVRWKVGGSLRKSFLALETPELHLAEPSEFLCSANMADEFEQANGHRPPNVFAAPLDGVPSISYNALLLAQRPALYVSSRHSCSIERSRWCDALTELGRAVHARRTHWKMVIKKAEILYLKR